MSTKTILAALLLFNSQFLLGQPGSIRFTTQSNTDGTVSIFANSQAYGEYSVKLTFTSLSGFTSRSLSTTDIAIASAYPGYAEIMKFTRERGAANFALQYRSQYFPGRSLHKMPDTAFQYLIPATAGNRLRVIAISSSVSPMSKQLKSEFRGTGFFCKAGDTICAARASIVYECSDTATEVEKAETVYRQGRNRIQVLQRDGTLGIYGITAPIKLLVAPGDEVFPGQPLAVFNNGTEKCRLYFSSCYLDEKKLLTGNVFDNSIYYTYVPTHFYGSGEESSSLLQLGKEYTVQHPKEIVAEEMTRREKKKFGL
jgi:hypothetical protein